MQEREAITELLALGYEVVCNRVSLDYYDGSYIVMDHNVKNKFPNIEEFDNLESALNYFIVSKEEYKEVL